MSIDEEADEMNEGATLALLADEQRTIEESAPTT